MLSLPKGLNFATSHTIGPGSHPATIIRPAGCAKKLGGSKEPFRDIAQADATAALVVVPTIVLRQAAVIARSPSSSWRRLQSVVAATSQ